MFTPRPSRRVPVLPLPLRCVQLSLFDAAAVSRGTAADADADSATARPSYAERLSSGLHVVQLCCLLLALLRTAGVPELSDHVERLFFQRDDTVEAVCSAVLRELSDHLNPQQEAGAAMQRTVVALLHMLGTPTQQQQPEHEAKEETAASNSIQ